MKAIVICFASCLFLFINAGDATLRLNQAEDHPRDHVRSNFTEATDERIQKLLSNSHIDDDQAISEIFELDEKAIPSLVSALREGWSLTRAARALAYLGGPDDRKILLKTIQTEKKSETRSELSAILAGALVEPASKEEWRFLENCLRLYKDKENGKAFVSFSAALALRVNGSQTALHVLERAESKEASKSVDNDAAQEITDAIRTIKHRSATNNASSPPGDSDSKEIEGIIARSTLYEDAEHPPTVEKVAFTNDKQRALAAVQIYRGPKDAEGYDIVLQRVGSAWRIVGIWATWAA